MSLQSTLDRLAKNHPDILAGVTTGATVGASGQPLTGQQPAGSGLKTANTGKTADEVRLNMLNGYLAAGNSSATGDNRPTAAPSAIGSDGKVVTWTPQGGSVTHDTPPAGFVQDPALTPDWSRDPLQYPQLNTGGGTGNGIIDNAAGGGLSGGTGGSSTVDTNQSGGLGGGGGGGAGGGGGLAGGTGGTGGTGAIVPPTAKPQYAMTATAGPAVTGTTHTAASVPGAQLSQAGIHTIDGSQLADAQVSNAQASQAGNASQYQGGGYTANQLGAGSATGAGDASLADTTTVQGLLGQILAQDSPLMQQARTNAMQQMAGRGLLNSSMAVGAGQQALYNVAMPIASQDAGAYNQTSMFNAGALNDMAKYNAGQRLQVEMANQAALNNAAQFGADATNRANAANAAAQNNMAQYNASNQQQAALQNAQAANNMAQFNTGNQFNILSQNMQAQNQGSQFNANQANNMSQFNQSQAQQNNQYNAGQQNQMEQYNASQTNQQNQFNAQQQNAMNQFNASQTNDILKTQLEHQNRTQLAGIEAQYKTLMQTNQSAGELYQQTIKNINDVSLNKDMDQASKTQYINNQLSYLKTGMGMFEAMNGMSGLSDVLVFTETP